MEVLWVVCERKECAEECLYQTPVMEVLLAPVAAQLSRPQVSPTYDFSFSLFFFFFFNVTEARFWKCWRHQQQTRFV